MLRGTGRAMGAVLAAGQDCGWTGDALMMAFRLGLLKGFELVEDRLQIGIFVPFGEKVREEMCQRRRAKRRAQILSAHKRALTVFRFRCPRL